MIMNSLLHLYLPGCTYVLRVVAARSYLAWGDGPVGGGSIGSISDENIQSFARILEQNWNLMQKMCHVKCIGPKRWISR